MFGQQKGILRGVTLNDQYQFNWTHFPLPLDGTSCRPKQAKKKKKRSLKRTRPISCHCRLICRAMDQRTPGQLPGPVSVCIALLPYIGKSFDAGRGTFQVQGIPLDTFLSLPGWVKGYEQ